MYRNYLKIAFRNLIRNKTYSIISIIGLAIGMTSFMLISMWVEDELSYDRFHERIENLYRVVNYEKYSNNDEVYFSQNSALLGPILKSNYPELLDYTRYRRGSKQLVTYNEKNFNQDGIVFADQSLFDLFSFPIIRGSKENILSDPYSIAITEEMAFKYFGSEDPIGKTIRINNKLDFKVTTLMENPPSNSHLRFNFIIPFSTIKEFGHDIETWRSWAYATYILLDNNADHHVVSEKIRNTIVENDEGSIATIRLQPISDIHLKSSHIWGLGGKGDIKYVYIFSIVALFILLTACFNFMNLATSQSAKRAKEIGLRKVIGAQRKEIVVQFLLEAIVVSSLALILSSLVTNLALPFFNELSQKEIHLSLADNRFILVLMLSTVLGTSLISGIYPALLLSGFQPVKVLKGIFKTGNQGVHFRRVLVSVQFVLTIVLIFSALVINRQLNFVRNQKLGFNKESVVSIYLPESINSRTDFIINELEQNSDIIEISAASSAPNKLRQSSIFSDWEGSDPDEQFLAHILSTDENYLDLFKLEMAKGRYFSDEFTSDTSAIVLNEAAVKAMNMDNPVGKVLRGSQIIGVVKDYHFQSLHEKINPQVFYYKAENPSYLLVKLSSESISKSISSLENIWKGIIHTFPMEFQFVDEYQEQMYHADKKVEKIINTFTFLALLIACLGLYGLTSFVAEQRTKEIGVRKVLGATIPAILLLLNKEFSKWILLSNVVAWPIAYYGMNKWLEGFAYRIEINIWFFLMAGGSAFILSASTISIQTIKAALANPVDSLRSE